MTGRQYNEGGDICTGGETLYRVQILRGGGRVLTSECLPPDTLQRYEVSEGRISIGMVLSVTAHTAAATRGFTMVLFTASRQNNFVEVHALYRALLVEINFRPTQIMFRDTIRLGLASIPLSLMLS